MIGWGLLWKGITGFLGKIPLWAYAAIAAVILMWWYGHHQYKAGAADTQIKWDAAVARGKAKVIELEAKAGQITVKTEIQYVDRIKVIHDKGETITKTVEVFVPATACKLDGGFRVYHDAAVNNEIPDPTKIANAAPISATEVARTVASNYEKCAVAYTTVDGWQKWATEQCKLNKDGCPDGH